MKRFQMRDRPATNLTSVNEMIVNVRQAPENRAIPCRPCEEKRRRELEAARESRQPS